MKKQVLSIFFLFLTSTIYSQIVYTHVSNKSVYDYIDELAAKNIIELNSVVKPYSRKFIAQKLSEAYDNKNLLNKRQAEELDFFLKDYYKEIKNDKKFNKRFDLFYYKDSVFTFSVNPILGYKYFVTDNKSYYHRVNGAETFAYIGKNIGIYASLRDNHESIMLSDTGFLNQNIGAKYKKDTKGGGDYNEMRGGITWSNRYLTLGLIKDHLVWGNNYNGSNILSGKTPSFVSFTINIKPVKWFEFNYFHGWLSSNIVDSLKSYNFYNGKRTVNRQKFVAANIFSFKPLKSFYISLGNSVIYSDIGFNPAYAMPIFFYKSMDQTYAKGDYDGQNSQMFFDISYRQIKNLHLYSSIFIDEISISQMYNKNKHSNWFSKKFGISFYGIPNTQVCFEYTRTNPIAYKHYIPTITYQSSSYTLGHYLKDNSEELYLMLKIKPLKKLSINFEIINAKRGKDYLRQGGAIDTVLLGLPFLDETKWKNNTISAQINYQIINDLYFNIQYLYSDVSGETHYLPQILNGKKNTFIAGMNFGF